MCKEMVLNFVDNNSRRSTDRPKQANINIRGTVYAKVRNQHFTSKTEKMTKDAANDIYAM